MTGENVSESEVVEPTKVVSAEAVDDQLIDELVGRAQAEGLQLTMRLLESALEGEITGHLGYDEYDAGGKNGGNSRSGKRSKTVLTDVGPVEITTHGDQAGGRRKIRDTSPCEPSSPEAEIGSPGGGEAAGVGSVTAARTPRRTYLAFWRDVWWSSERSS